MVMMPIAFPRGTGRSHDLKEGGLLWSSGGGGGP